MSDNDGGQDFLWKVFYLAFEARQFKRAIEEVEKFYSSAGQLPLNIDKALSAFWSSGKESDLLDLAVLCIANSFFDVYRRTKLVAFLLKLGRFDVMSAVDYLDFRGTKIDHLPASIKKVADVVWLLREDRERGTPNIDDDRLLADALLEVAKDGLSGA